MNTKCTSDGLNDALDGLDVGDDDDINDGQ
jgi:hypothetical protein